MVYNMAQTVLLYVAFEAGSKMQKWFLQNLIAMCSKQTRSLWCKGNGEKEGYALMDFDGNLCKIFILF